MDNSFNLLRAHLNDNEMAYINISNENDTIEDRYIVLDKADLKEFIAVLNGILKEME